MKRAVLVLVVITFGSAAGYRYLQSQVYHPVVRLSLPEGLSLTAVLPQTKERGACEDSTKRFLAPFKQQCKECKILFSQCQRSLEGVELAMRQGLPVPYPMVVANELRMAVIGSAEKAKVGCQLVATDLAAKGLKSAACVPAQGSPGKS